MPSPPTTRPPLKFRGYAPQQDDPIIFDPWVSRTRAMEPLSKLPPEDLVAHRLTVMEPLLASGRAIVACNPDFEYQVYGWALAAPEDQGQVLHFVFVKDHLRRLGLATALLERLFPAFRKEILNITYQTRQTRHLLVKWNAVFNPYKVGLVL